MSHPSQITLSAVEAYIDSKKHLPLDERRAMFERMKQDIKVAEQNTIKTSEEQILALAANLAMARAGFQEAGGDISSAKPFIRKVADKLNSSSAAENVRVPASFIKRDYPSFTHIVINLHDESLDSSEGVSLRYDDEKGYSLKATFEGECSRLWVEEERTFCFLPENFQRIVYWSHPEGHVDHVSVLLRGSGLESITLHFQAQSDFYKFGKRIELETGVKAEVEDCD